jgi:uncharacterized protein (TIRG00374 family)
MHPWRGWKSNVVGLLISFACLGFIAWRVDLDELVSAMANFKWGWLSLGFTSLAFGYTARIFRWSSLLRAAGANVPTLSCAAPFLGSIALNNILPMRLGDVVRALVFPSAIGINRIIATGSLVMERLVDLMTLLACLMIGLVLTSQNKLPDWLLPTALGLGITGSAILILVFLFSGKLSRWLGSSALKMSASRRARMMGALGELLTSFEAMSRWPVLLSLFVLSMLVWVGEAGLYWSLLRGYGLEASPSGAVVVMAIATLSTLVPSSPGYIGPFHLAAFSAVVMLGGSNAQAASFAVLAHLGVWLPTTIAGALAIFFNPQLFGSTITKPSI